MRAVAMLALVAALVSGVMAAPAQTGPAVQTVHSDNTQTHEMHLTIYNDNLALVREIRDVTLPTGEINLEFADVAEKIDPTSVHIASLTNPNRLGVLEQNFEYDLLSPDRLLENFLGRTVRFTTRSSTDPGLEVSRTGTLLSVQGGRIIQTDEGLVINPTGELSVEADTGDLRSKPTLIWLLRNGSPAQQSLEASYLTSGISWKADYVGIVSSDESHIDLTGWVTIDNQSGATYRDAGLKLVAGTVHRAPQPQERLYMARGAVAEVAGLPQFQEEQFFEYHLYTLQRPTTVRDRQTKQMTLLTADGVGITKRYLFEAPQIYSRTRTGGSRGEPEHVKVKVEFDNSESNHMGMPLPQGTVRLYRADSEGALQFLGEDAIQHTPRDERVRLTVGEAFDIVAERVQTNYQELLGDRTQQSWEITVRNHKDEAVTVTLVEHPAGDWDVTTSSHPFNKTESDTFEIPVEVPANGETVVTYTIRFQNS
jgi:hypothetical protein